MNKLYRKHQYPSGRVRYDEVCDLFDTGDPADGIWYVKRTKSGRSMKWITQRLEDLPKARVLAELEPLRDTICKAILDIRLEHRKTQDGYMLTIPCASDVCDKIFQGLAEQELNGI